MRITEGAGAEMGKEAAMHKIVAHHVGARGYGVSLNVPATFGPDIAHVLYEADADAVKRMESELDSAHARMLSEKYVLPFCLGKKNARALLNITRNSYASSLFSPNKEFHRYYCEIPIDAAVYDVTYEAMLEVVRQVDVEIHSLDELLAAGKVPIARAPDFLSLDTQGYELEILHGASKALAEGVLGMVSEVEMLPMYAGQPLLGDILKFAADHGFLFAGFTALYDVSPARAPIGARGKALPGFGDALFFRDLATLTEDKFPVEKLYVMLRKLAFIAVSFGYIEYGIAALNQAEELKHKVPSDVLSDAAAHKYNAFLDEMMQVVNQMEKLFPPVHAVPDDARPKGDTHTSWYNKYHQAALQRYAEAMRPSATSPAEQAVEPIEQVKKFRLARAIYRALPEGIARRLRRLLFPAPMAPAAAPQAAVSPRVTTYTRLEELLENWGLAGPAYIVRQRRLSAEPYVRSLSPEMAEAGKHAHIPSM